MCQWLESVYYSCRRSGLGSSHPYQGSHNRLNRQIQGTQHPFLAYGGTALTCTHTYRYVQRHK